MTSKICGGVPNCTFTVNTLRGLKHTVFSKIMYTRTSSKTTSSALTRAEKIR